MVWSSCTHLKLTLCCPSVRFPPHYNYTFVCMDVLLGGAEHAPSMGWSQTVGCMPIQILPQHSKGASEQVGTIYILYVHGTCTCWSLTGSLGDRWGGQDCPLSRPQQHFSTWTQHQMTSCDKGKGVGSRSA